MKNTHSDCHRNRQTYTQTDRKTENTHSLTLTLSLTLTPRLTLTLIQTHACINRHISARDHLTAIFRVYPQSPKVSDKTFGDSWSSVSEELKAHVSSKAHSNNDTMLSIASIYK